MDIMFLLTLMMSNKKWDILSKNHFTLLELYIISYYVSVIYQIAISTKIVWKINIFFNDVMLERWILLNILKEFSSWRTHYDMNYRDSILHIFFSRQFIYVKCVSMWKQRRKSLLKLERTTKFSRIIVNKILLWDVTSKSVWAYE